MRVVRAEEAIDHDLLPFERFVVEEEAAELMETDFHAWGMLSTCYRAVGDVKKLREAARMMVSESEKAVQQDPSNGAALGMLARDGTCVILGVSESEQVTFDARQFFIPGRTRLYGLYLFTEMLSEPASVGLRRLADYVVSGQLSPHVSLVRPWTEIAQVAQDLMSRRFPGKAVLTLD